MMRAASKQLPAMRASLVRGAATVPALPAFDYKPQKYAGPTYEQVAAARKSHLSPAIFAYYRQPLLLVEGKQQYLFDHTGKRYLDMFAGIVTVSVGHCHPAIVKAGTDQLQKLIHSTTIYYNPEVSLFAKELAAKLPPHLSVIYFTNSGSEATDLALLMARLFTGSNDIVALRNGYHGMSQGSMGLTALHTWKYPVPQNLGLLHALNPNRFRGPFGYDDTDAAKKYADDVKDLIVHCTSNKIAGFIAETIQGVGGSVELPDGYLQHVYKHVRDHGGVCIADEVQSGFGRMGTHYWGFQTQGVQPDIVTMAKGIGNGIPLAAVATTPAIAQKLADRIHFNTYGGNPVSSAIGRAVLRVIDEERIQEKALMLGKQLKDGLLQLQKKYPIIGDVRGKGLMLGAELVRNIKTKEPATPELVEIFERCREHGLLLGKGGLYGNVFRIKPPMCITSDDVKFTLEVMDEAFAHVLKR